MLLTAARGGLVGLRVAIAKCVLGKAAAGHPIPDEWAVYRMAHGVTTAFTGAKTEGRHPGNRRGARPTGLYTAIALARRSHPSRSRAGQRPVVGARCVMQLHHPHSFRQQVGPGSTRGKFFRKPASASHTGPGASATYSR
jgi:hypothetical protein